MSAELQQPVFRPTDDAEPKAERSPAPVLLIGLFALLFYWGCTHLADHGGGFSPVVYRPYQDTVQLADLQPSLGEEAELKKFGELTFNNTCSVCHQTTGLGSTTTGCPPLVGSEWVQGGGPNRIIRLVLNGGVGSITVKGQQYPGTTPMTPFRDALTDKQIAAALTYVRSAWGNNAGMVKPEQVKAIRDSTADKKGNWTAADLLQIPDK